MAERIITDVEHFENLLVETIQDFNIGASGWKKAHHSVYVETIRTPKSFELLRKLLQPPMVKPGSYESQARRPKVLDIGCGVAQDARVFIGNGIDYTGIDWSSISVQVCRQFNSDIESVYGAAPQFYHMDMRNMEFNDKTFDGLWAVTSLDYLEPLYTDFLDRALGQAARVLRRSAYGFISLEGGSNGIGYAADNRSSITKYLNSDEEFRCKLKRAGFEVIHHDHIVDDDMREVDLGIKGPGEMTLQYYVRRK